MIKSIYLAARNLNLKMKNMEIVANNLANINTNGYKRELPFAEVLSETKSNLSNISDLSNGNFIQTNNPLDLAIEGEGFFAVERNNNLLLTRDGRFTLNEDGFLINRNGEKVLGEKGPIVIDKLLLDAQKSFTITKEGEIKIGELIVDKLRILKLDEKENAIREGAQGFVAQRGNYLQAEESNYSIFQGYVEESNVNPIEEMQTMITLNKNFEATQKIVNSLDNYLGKVNEIGKV